MAHIKTIPLKDLILQQLSDPETALYFIMAHFEEQLDAAEIISAVQIVASAQGLERRRSNTLANKIAELQKLPLAALTLEHMNDVLKEAYYV